MVSSEYYDSGRTQCRQTDTPTATGVCVIPLSPAQKPLALQVTTYLIQHGIGCDTLLDDQSIKSMFKYADDHAARFAVILGEGEQADGTATVKDMHLGTQTLVKQHDLVAYLTKNHLE